MKQKNFNIYFFKFPYILMETMNFCISYATQSLKNLVVNNLPNDCNSFLHKMNKYIYRIIFPV